MRPSEQIVSDLLWIIHTPSLIAAQPLRQDFGVEVLDFPSQHSPTTEAWIRAPQTQAKLVRLETECRLSSRRVGNYFERLVLFVLEEWLCKKILQRNLQIFEGSHTVGEIDCLYEDSAGITHLEVAVKFFLHTQDETRPHQRILPAFSELASLVGPNPADTLASKLTHLVTKQLPLSESANARQALKVSVQRREILMKGVIHYHRNHLEQPPVKAGAENGTLNPNCTRGSWFRVGELAEQLDAMPENTTFHIPDKPFWLAPQLHQPLDQQRLEDRLARLNEGNHAALLYIRRGEEHPIERCFIVNDHWPHWPPRG